MQQIVSLVQAIKDLWPIKINKDSEIWAANHYKQFCIYMGGLHQLVTVGKKIWFWNFWDLDTKWPGHLWLIIEH